MEYKIRETSVTADKGEPTIVLPEGSIVVAYSHHFEELGKKGTEWEGFHMPERWEFTYLEPVKE